MKSSKIFSGWRVSNTAYKHNCLACITCHIFQILIIPLIKIVSPIFNYIIVFKTHFLQFFTYPTFSVSRMCAKIITFPSFCFQDCNLRCWRFESGYPFDFRSGQQWFWLSFVNVNEFISFDLTVFTICFWNNFYAFTVDKWASILQRLLWNVFIYKIY